MHLFTWICITPQWDNTIRLGFLWFSLAYSLILFDVLTLINIVKNTIQKHHGTKLQRNNYSSRNYSNPLLTQAIFSEIWFFTRFMWQCFINSVNDPFSRWVLMQEMKLFCKEFYLLRITEQKTKPHKNIYCRHFPSLIGGK